MSGSGKHRSGGYTPPDLSEMKSEFINLASEQKMKSEQPEENGFSKLKKEYQEAVQDFHDSVADQIDNIAAGDKVKQVLSHANQKVSNTYDNATTLIDEVFNNVANLTSQISTSLDNAYDDIGGTTTMTNTKPPKTKTPQTKIELLMSYINKLDLTKIENKDIAHQVQQIMFLAAQLAKDFQTQMSYEKMMERVSDQRTQQQNEIMEQYWKLLQWQDQRTEMLERRANLYKKQEDK